MNATVTEDEKVVKGQIVAYSFRSDNKYSQFEHLHFEVRAGGLFQANCCNPWKYLPNVNNDYTSFIADIQLYPNYNDLNCEAVVNISVPADQLTMNRIELHIVNAGVDSVRTFDFCEDNLERGASTVEELDNPLFEENLYISPGVFNSRSYQNGDNATYGFHYLSLPETQGDGDTLRAVAYDVFGNSVETSLMHYTCNGNNSISDNSTPLTTQSVAETVVSKGEMPSSTGNLNIAGIGTTISIVIIQVYFTCIHVWYA